jgi:hypothetical protein
MFDTGVIYPSDYDDDDKAEYDYLITLGQGTLGNTIPKNQAFLLSIAAKMTIREHKGGKQDLTKEEIEALKAYTTEHLKNGFVHETPKMDWVSSLDNPINQPYMPTEVVEQIKTYDEVYKKNKDDEITEVIKSDWVKLCPSTSNIECATKL